MQFVTGELREKLRPIYLEIKELRYSMDESLDLMNYVNKLVAILEEAGQKKNEPSLLHRIMLTRDKELERMNDPKYVEIRDGNFLETQMGLISDMNLFCRFDD